MNDEHEQDERDEHEWQAPRAWQAPPDTVWVCQACGKFADRRDKVGDESCFLWAVLCDRDSLVLAADGRARQAQARST